MMPKRSPSRDGAGTQNKDQEEAIRSRKNKPKSLSTQLLTIAPACPRPALPLRPSRSRSWRP